ncbi:MAG: ribosome small subunit-dependent GTPase A [Caulobacteraceae bacterium]|nr:ribosome small subunit-dependent GTPase A [Caulobacteraceae bacterium]
MIKDHGWSDALQQAFAPYAARGLIPGRVIVQQRGLFHLATERGELAAEPTGRLLHAGGDYPVAGDWVAAAEHPGGASIHAVLPRRTAFVRRAANTSHEAQVVAANVDVALLTASLNADFNPRRLERYLAAAWQSGARPVVVLTKADLSPDLDAARAAAEAVAFGEPVVCVSALTGEGLAALLAHLAAGETAVLLGSSGVGKSTLVNALMGEGRMDTGAIRQDDARGRHTTTHRELVRLPGGALLLDTPGMRELGLWDAEEAVGALFEDVEAIAGSCRYSDCGHRSEPGCAVRAALETGALDPGRWAGWRKLQKELAFQARQSDPLAREAHRRRWIQVSKANRAARRWRGE